MTVSLAPIGGAASQFFNSGGVPLYGGKIYTYEAGTTTPKATYTEANGLTAHPNPIVLDSAGRVPGGEIWLTSAQAYLFSLKTSSDELIGTYDNIYGINAGSANAVTETQVATAGQTSFVLTSMAYTPGVFTLGVYIDGVNQVVNNSYVETSATTVTFVSGLHAGALVKFININSAATDANAVTYLPAGTGAVATTIQAKLRESVSVKDFGADPSGNSDSRAAIQACIDYAQSLGGGIVYFPPGNYRLDSLGVLGHLNLVNYSNIYMLGYGAKLTSTMMDESRMFWSFDGARNIVVDGFELQATFVRSGSTHVTGGVGVFRLAATSQDSNNISIRNVRAYDVYYFLTAIRTSSFSRVRGVTIDNCLGVNGYYGLNFQNEGDLVTARNFRTTNFVRTYFPYGVSNHDIQYESRGGDVFTDCLIKAYDYDTTDIKVTAKIINNTSNDSHVTLESQHAPATQPVPAVLKNIELNIDDLQAGGTGPSLRFAYFQDTPNPVQTPTSAVTLFGNIRVRGNVRNFLQFAVAQPVNSGAISLAGFVYNPVGSGDPYDFGFYEPVSRYTRGDNNFSFCVQGNKGFAVDGTHYFRDFAGNEAGSFDGTIGVSGFRFTANVNKPYQLYYTTGYVAGINVLDVNSSAASSFGFKVYEGANSGTPNAANAVVKIGQMNVTGRSINTAGTINASGADYAEYEWNNGLDILKGSIVGFKANGTLTLDFADAVRFGIKSTDPAIVGGDTWAPESLVGVPPSHPVRKMPVVEKGFDEVGRHIEVVVEVGDTDAEWAAKQSTFQTAWDAYQARIEVQRAKVDRIAYSGKVPVNVVGAKAGDYIIAITGSDGKIRGTSITNPDFAQYLRAVGRVNRALQDGRAEVAVIIH